jgi:rod shape-determining protein MreC
MRFIYTKTFVRIFTAFVLVSLFAILDMTGSLGFAKNGFSRIFGGTAKGISNVTGGVKNTFSTLATIRSLVRENSEAEQKIQELTFENARLKASQNENISLRRTLGFRQQSGLNMVAAELLTLDPTGFNQTITLDKGQESGIEAGEAVVVAPGILVAKITRVYGDFSEATLITDPDIAVNAEVVDSGAKGLIRGEHGLTLALDLLTQNDLIKTGDQVVTSGLSGDFPAGLLIGSIAAVRSQNTELFQKAYVSSAADLRNLKFLYVVKR